MAQETMIVRTDAQLKEKFDSLCQQFGMSANTAMNIFMRAVAETRSIPFTICAKETSKERLCRIMEENRLARLDEPEITLDEINEEIAAYRAERKK